MRSMKIILLILVPVAVCENHTGSHALNYYFTGLSSSDSRPPFFSVIGYVDDKQIDRYDSDGGQAQPVAEWMSLFGGPRYWETETKKRQTWVAEYREHFKVEMSISNQTQGLCVYQVLFGCELDADGSSRSYYLFGYQGKEHIRFDKDRMLYEPATERARITTDRWNGERSRQSERDKTCLETICIEWLKKYIRYGKEELEKKIPPEVTVTSLSTRGVTRLHCWVYGFYPRHVDVTWMRNEKDELYSEEAKQILPNSDGTYQVRVTVEVMPQDGDSYACHVDHCGLQNVLVTRWDPVRRSFLYELVGVPVLVLVIIAAGFFMYKKMPLKKNQHGVIFLRGNARGRRDNG
ncbi:patr class I histocompatibility antigen, B-1 alpha chain-like [Spea bombifrons]|uniref:patr class I histocompatibility antigen, B-1 alpha chain-like n=1 Tax=Spea bombifrons TaxID=233779 RepID=UPI00234B6A18|nr:patr class I histocompatibility antigen, B-1 alpha chain-like [Spea bombifrons]